MFRSFDYREDTPRDIFRFEALWLVFIVLSMTVAILRYDHLVAQVGRWGTAALEIVLIGSAVVLMVYASRRRSNLARWLLVIASVLLVFPYVAHLIDTMPDRSTGYTALLQIAAQAAALACLFTHMSRDWFAGRPARQLALDDL